MRGMGFATVAICAAVWMGSFAQGQSLREISGPRELPPASYTSDQYVDSRGCVFIRAGYGGTVTWVPRVGNNRKPICGVKTSISAPVVAAVTIQPQQVVGTAPAQPAARPQGTVGKPIDTVASIATPPRIRATLPTSQPIPEASYVPARVAAAQTTAQPAARARVVTSQSVCPAAPAGTRRALSDGRQVMECGTDAMGATIYLVVGPAGMPAPAVAAAAQPTVRVPASQSAAPTRVAAAAAPTACGNLPMLSQVFLVNDGRLVVRCGAKTAGKPTYLVVGRADVDGISGGVADASGGAAPRAIPRGYKTAWNDGRLSATRTTRTAAGEASMHLVWSDDTPRRLLDGNTGQDVTVDFAYLVYPYTDYARQQQAVITGQRPVKLAAVQVAAAEPAAPSPRLSTKTAPQAAVESSGDPAMHRYVQVGSFGQPENVKVAIARLQALGLPVAISKMSRGGKALQVVLAGPFDQQSAVNAALAAARESGFADAFARN